MSRTRNPILFFQTRTRFELRADTHTAQLFVRTSHVGLRAPQQILIMQRRLLLQQQRQGEVMTQSALWHIEGAAAGVLLQEEPHGPLASNLSCPFVKIAEEQTTKPLSPVWQTWQGRLRRRNWVTTEATRRGGSVALFLAATYLMW